MWNSTVSSNFHLFSIPMVSYQRVTNDILEELPGVFARFPRPGGTAHPSPASMLRAPGLLGQPGDISLWHPIDLGSRADLRLVSTGPLGMGIWWGYWHSDWWLVGSLNPSEKYESQLGWLFQIYGKTNNVPNHQPDDIQCSLTLRVVPCGSNTGRLEQIHPESDWRAEKMLVDVVSTRRKT